jgi:3-hydroxyacyl-CoA dehydrogenase
MIRTPIVLEDIRKDRGRVLAQNASASLLDLDDGVLCLEFHSKGNTLDGDTIEIAEHAFEIIPGRLAGLVIGNQGTHFSFGANLRWLLRLLDEIDGDRTRFHAMAKRFQRVTTGMRTAPFPTVAAPFGLTIGGALELSMYVTRVQSHAGVQMTLPEVAVGILPDLGGTSELYARCVEASGAGNEGAALRRAFETIAFMHGSKNADEARAMHFLRSDDRVTEELERLLDDAKARVLELAVNYEPRAHRRAIPVLGDIAFNAMSVAIDMAVQSGIATAYDGDIARAIARVMTGGPGASRTVTHEELLDSETQYFETLVFDERTRARMEHMLEHGTPLRN